MAGTQAPATLPLPTAQAVDILAQFARVTDHRSPKVVAQVNDQYVKVARLLGEMDWHRPANEDELFWVRRGRLRLEFRDHVVELAPGHETVTTLHTGDRSTSQTRSIAEQLAP